MKVPSPPVLRGMEFRQARLLEPGARRGRRVKMRDGLN